MNQTFLIFRCRAVTGADVYTKELTLAIRDEIYNLYGEYPHVIINELHRSKLDANRKIGQAALGIPSMEEAWRQVRLKYSCAQKFTYPLQKLCFFSFSK